MQSETHDVPASALPSELGAPARRALIGAGYTHLEQFIALSKAELGRLHGVGPKALSQLRRALSSRGWAFTDENGG